MAIGHKVFSACCVEEWAVQKHMLYHLDWLAARAGHLFWSVEGVEPSHVFPYGCVSRDDMVECCVCFA